MADGDHLGERPPPMATIMIVDDHADLLESMSEALEFAGHKVVTACNGSQALHLVSSSVFDLIITDLIMPEKEGLETIRELRRHYPSLRIIAMSGSLGRHRECMLHMANLFGAVQTLDKPFSEQVLLTTVTAVLKGG